MNEEWYRAWRHEDRDRDLRWLLDRRFRRREQMNQIVGDACIVAAIVVFVWASMPG